MSSPLPSAPSAGSRSTPGTRSPRLEYSNALARSAGAAAGGRASRIQRAGDSEEAAIMASQSIDTFPKDEAPETKRARP